MQRVTYADSAFIMSYRIQLNRHDDNIGGLDLNMNMFIMSNDNEYQACFGFERGLRATV